MKQLLILSCIFILFGCKGKDSEPEYPKYVKNKCTGMWAIQIDRFDWFGDPQIIVRYPPNSQAATLWSLDRMLNDSTVCVLGQEIQFTTKQAAISALAPYIKKWKDAAIKQHISDSLNAKVQNSNDSIFKCQHTYQ